MRKQPELTQAEFNRTDIDRLIARAHRLRGEHTARLVQSVLARLRRPSTPHRGNGRVATP